MNPLAPAPSWALLPPESPLSQRLLALGLILGLGLLGLVLLRQGARAIQTRLHQAWRDRFTGLRLGQLDLVTGAQVRRLLHRLVDLLRLASALMLGFAVCSMAFSLFLATQGLAGRLLRAFWEPLGTFGHAALDYLPRGMALLLIFFGIRMLLGLLKALFASLSQGEGTPGGFDPEWARPTYTLVRLGVLAFALVLAVPYLPGAGSDAFKAVSLFIGVLVSLGSSGTIGNFISGSVLTYLRAYRVGDVVKLGNHTGIVVDRTLLITRLRTFKEEEVVLSNASVLGGPILNHSARLDQGGPFLHTSVSIGYTVPWQQVHALLLEAAHRTEGIGTAPAPFVLQAGLGDFYVTYELNAATRHPERLPWLYSDLHQHIQDTFAEAGVEIMSPHVTQVRDGHALALPTGHGPHPPLGGFRLDGGGRVMDSVTAPRATDASQ